MKNLLIIGTVWPEPNSTAAGKRMLQLIELFQELDFKISFCSAASRSEHSEDLETLGISCQDIKMNDGGFDEFIAANNPEIVIFDRFLTEEQFGWRVSESCPNAIKILDTEDLHFLRRNREEQFKNKAKQNIQTEITDIFKREMASILRCDLSLIISEFEYELLVEKYKIDIEILYYIPLFAEKFSGLIPGFADRKHFMHIGNFLHEPNWQSVLVLKQYWKEIRKRLPGAELHIYGSYVSEKAKQLHNQKEGFLIKGRAESAKDIFLNYRVLLAPIPFGAGIKGKLLESMQFGLPNVTTEVGAEGMKDSQKWNGFIAKSQDDFIKNSIELYKVKRIFEKSQNIGYEILSKKFNKNNFAKDFKKRIINLITDLKRHRENNFLGQILQHHSLQSTKYMGKWIEEKNKK